MKKFLSSFWEIFKIFIIALAIVIPIRYFLFQPFLVKGESMEPNFKNGDYLIIDEISLRFTSLQRGEVVVFKFPQDTSQRLIKRIIGLPGETVQIKDEKVTIIKNNDQPLNEAAYLPGYIRTSGDLNLTLGQDEYFVLGDNRSFSYDSRRFGVLPKKDIIGRVFIRAWPFAALSKINIPTY